MLIILMLGFIGGIFCLRLVGLPEDADFFLRAFSGVGVLCAVLLALYGDAIKGWVNPIELSLARTEAKNNYYDLEGVSGVLNAHVRVFVHHLRVVNSTPHRPVINCRVWLVGIHDYQDNAFKENIVFAVPRLMLWAPGEFSPEARSFSQDQVFDFGKTYLNFTLFKLSHHRREPRSIDKTVMSRAKQPRTGELISATDLDLDCLMGERRRYIFRITADNYLKANLHTVEVTLNPANPNPDGYRVNPAEVEIVTGV